MYCYKKRPGVAPDLFSIVLSLAFCRLGVIVLEQSMLIDVAFVPGFIRAVAYDSVLISDEEQGL